MNQYNQKPNPNPNLRVVKNKFNQSPKKPKQPVKDLYSEFLGKQTVCIQKGNISVTGGFHSYEKGILLFTNAVVTFNFANPEKATNIKLTSVMVDRTTIQMMYEPNNPVTAELKLVA